MQKRNISVFFLILFMLFITAPTVISMIEKSFDTAVFFSINEEENKVNETLKTFEARLSDLEKFCFSIFDIEKEKSYIFYLKNYVSFYLEGISPPPELG